MKQRAPQSGLSLIELMVGITVGLIVLAAALTLHSQGSARYRLSEAQIRLNEQSAFALDALLTDIRLAGFWGIAGNPARISIPPALRIHCRVSGADISDFALDLKRGLAALDNSDQLPCPASRPRADSDVLIIRHASARRMPPESGQIQLQAGLLSGVLFADGIAPALAGPASETHDVQLGIWYVSERSGFDSTQPALRRLTLVRHGRIEDQEIIAGIENMQLRLGLDTSGDGAVNFFTDPAHAAAAGPGQIVALRLWLLVRSDEPEAGWQDTKVWQPPDPQLAPIVPGVTPGYPARYRRLAVTRTVALRNGPQPQ